MNTLINYAVNSVQTLTLINWFCCSFMAAGNKVLFFLKYSTDHQRSWECLHVILQLATLPVYFLYLGVLLVVVLLGADPAAHQVVPHSVSQGEVVVPGRGDIPVLDQGEVQVTVKVPLDPRNVFEPRDATHANLFPLLLVAERRRHVF